MCSVCDVCLAVCVLFVCCVSLLLGRLATPPAARARRDDVACGGRYNRNSIHGRNIHDTIRHVLKKTRLGQVVLDR